MIKQFFQKIRAKALIFRLHKLTASAIVFNKQLQKSNLPDDLKKSSSKLLELYVGYLMLSYSSSNSNK